MLSAILWLVQKALRGSAFSSRLTISVGAFVLLCTCATMAGYVRLYDERVLRDSRQVAAVVRTIAAAELPRGTIVVPYRFDGEPRTRSQLLLAGVFEAPWSAKDALNAAYRREDLRAVTANRLVPWQFEGEPGNAASLRIGGEPVSVDQLLVLMLRGEVAVPVRRLVLNGCGRPMVFDLLLGARLAERGIPTEEMLQVADSRACAAP